MTHEPRPTRGIRARIVVEADLLLQSPAHFGGGDGDPLTDMPLLVDPRDGVRPLLPGSSVAGALRHYLRQRQYGYAGSRRNTEGPAAWHVRLFGSAKGAEEDDGAQSPLIVEDALGEGPARTERRWGVAIAPATRTAAAQKLYDAAYWGAGTRFPLRFELALTRSEDDAALLGAFATALDGLRRGEVALGARTRRGFGRVGVAEWRVRRFDLATRAGLLDWIAAGGQRPLPAPYRSQDPFGALGAQPDEADARRTLRLSVICAVDGSLLVHAGDPLQDGPDRVHVHSWRGARAEPVLPGTSLAGAWRARARRIARTLCPAEAGKRADALVAGLFGADARPGGGHRAGKVRVAEAVVAGGVRDLVHTRVSIDRFTGGAREGLLFSEQPLYGGADGGLCIELRCADPSDAEVGLLLLVLKDLWTGDLPVGGGAGVGRGRLRGRSATLAWDGRGTWRLEADPARADGVRVTHGSASDLEALVSALLGELEVVAG